MLRFFYHWLLRFHPARFRERFAEEMSSIFDDVGGGLAGAKLVADAFLSLVRQWTVRSEYWEEKAVLSVPGARNSPVFYTFENYKPRKSALIEGAILTWTVCAVVFLAIKHSKVHYMYVPSVSFDSVAEPDFKLPKSTANSSPTPVGMLPRTQSAIEPQTNSSERNRLSPERPMPSKANSAAAISVSREQPRFDVKLPKSTPSSPPAAVRVRPRTQSVLESGRNSSETNYSSSERPISSHGHSSAGVSESQEQARLDASSKLRRATTIGPPVQSLGQPFVPATRISKETLLSYVGVYLTDAPDKLTVVITAEDEHLLIEIPGEQKSMLVPVHGAKFAFSDAQDNWIQFMKNDNGAVDGLRVHRNGSELRGHRKTN